MKPRAKAAARLIAALGGLAMLAGCLAPAPALKPQPRPAGLVKPAPPPPAPKGPSAESQALLRHYQRQQDRALARGLMRVDGGGPDTRFSADDLARNFETIAFGNEHPVGARSGTVPVLFRWERPVRYKLVFGASVDDAMRRDDTRFVASFAARLGRITGHPIGVTRSKSANFHVLVMGLDDRAELLAQVRAALPTLSTAGMNLVRNLGPATDCLVMTVPGQRRGEYGAAVAILRPEQPALLHRACIHEELSQGLGLLNDSPTARPSIYNDDEEFAYLTTHDEMLLKILYDPRLKPGMTLAEARPLIRQIAGELTANSF